MDLSTALRRSNFQFFEYFRIRSSISSMFTIAPWIRHIAIPVCHRKFPSLSIGAPTTHQAAYARFHTCTAPEGHIREIFACVPFTVSGGIYSPSRWRRGRRRILVSRFGARLSMACSIVSVVNTPKITGIDALKPICATPSILRRRRNEMRRRAPDYRAQADDRVIVVRCRDLLVTDGISNDPGTQSTVILSSDALFRLRQSSAPPNSFCVMNSLNRDMTIANLRPVASRFPSITFMVLPVSSDFWGTLCAYNPSVRSS